MSDNNCETIVGSVASPESHQGMETDATQVSADAHSLWEDSRESDANADGTDLKQEEAVDRTASPTGKPSPFATDGLRYRLLIIAPSGRQCEFHVDRQFAAHVALDAAFDGTGSRGASLPPFPISQPGREEQNSLTDIPPHLSHVGKIVALLVRDSGGNLGKRYGRSDLRRLYGESGLDKPGDWGREIGLCLNRYRVLQGDPHAFSLTHKALEEVQRGYKGLAANPRFKREVLPTEC